MSWPKKGFALSSFNLFRFLDVKRLKTTKHILKRIYNTKEHKEVAGRIFTSFMKLVVTDIIENNIKFNFPKETNASLYMSEIPKYIFDLINRNGGFEGIDLIKTGFKAYRIKFAYEDEGLNKYKFMYVSEKLKQSVIDHTNEMTLYK